MVFARRGYRCVGGAGGLPGGGLHDSRGDAASFVPEWEGRGGGRSANGGLVDQRAWQTAQTLAGLAGSTEEKNFAREAQRLADHEVDQAFAQALRQASAGDRQLKGAALELQQRVTELQQIVKDDTARVAALTAKVAAEVGRQRSDQDDLDVAKAQLGLDNDEFSDSQEDLARESGDQRGKIQQELSAREAAMKKYDASLDGETGQTAVVSAGRFRTLAGQISAWFAQRNECSCWSRRRLRRGGCEGPSRRTMTVWRRRRSLQRRRTPGRRPMEFGHRRGASEGVAEDGCETEHPEHSG